MYAFDTIAVFVCSSRMCQAVTAGTESPFWLGSEDIRGMQHSRSGSEHVVQIAFRKSVLCQVVDAGLYHRCVCGKVLRVVYSTATAASRSGDGAGLTAASAVANAAGHSKCSGEQKGV